MTFSSDLRAFALKVERKNKGVFLGAATGVQESVVDGSPVTGAPGQPVDTGSLKGSWQLTFPGQWEAELATRVEYAPAVEEGIGPHGPMTLRSEVGGFHSVKATRANFDRLVEQVNREQGP